MRQANTSDTDWGLGRPGGWRATSVYGAAHLSKSLFWYGGEVVFAYFLTQFAGLPPTLMGLVLTVGLLFSAGMDLLVGFGLRAQMASPSLAGRLQMVGAFIAAVGLIAFLSTPYAPQAGRWMWALVTVSLFRIGFALYDVPQNALMSLGTANPAARSRVAAVRIAGSGLASIAVAALVGPMIAAAKPGGEGARLVVTVGAAAALSAVISAAALAFAVRQDPLTAPIPVKLKGESGRLRQLWPYFAMMAAMMAGPPLFQKLEPYYADQVLRSPSWGGAIILVAAFGVMTGQPVWLAMAERSPSRSTLFRVTAVIQALGGLVFLASPASLPLLLAFAAFLVGLGNGGLGVAKWAAFSDAASRAGAGREGLAFALFCASGKLTLAFGVVVVVAALEAARTDVRFLAWTMALGPILGSAAMVLLSYSVDPGQRTAGLAQRG